MRLFRLSRIGYFTNQLLHYWLVFLILLQWDTYFLFIKKLIIGIVYRLWLVLAALVWFLNSIRYILLNFNILTQWCFLYLLHFCLNLFVRLFFYLIKKIILYCYFLRRSRVIWFCFRNLRSRPFLWFKFLLCLVLHRI